MLLFNSSFLCQLSRYLYLTYLNFIISNINFFSLKYKTDSLSARCASIFNWVYKQFHSQYTYKLMLTWYRHKHISLVGERKHRFFQERSRALDVRRKSISISSSLSGADPPPWASFLFISSFRLCDPRRIEEHGRSYELLFVRRERSSRSTFTWHFWYVYDDTASRSFAQPAHCN